MTETFAQIPLARIVASLTNPRKHFNAERLAELAESIRASGVHQPILVRPLPGCRLAETAHMDPRPEYELVCGDRRARASILAGKATIPALVRPLTDTDVLEIQVIENLQRDDLHPLEEAEGYERLMHAHEPPLTADQIGERIGKSRSYVYARLKLLNLCAEGQAAMVEGWLEPSTALLVARAPSSKMQIDILGNLKDWRGNPISHRDAAALIEHQYMLRLTEAKFKITDATLVPAAGSCRECPKRTGADPDLFADVKGADVCTDPPCFRGKEAAHADRQLEQAKANGQTIISGREAKALMPSLWDNRVDGHLRLDHAADSPTDKPLRALIGKQMEKQGVHPLLVANPHKDGELISVLPRETVSQLLAAKGYQEQADAVQAQGQESAKAEAKALKDKRTAEFESTWRTVLLEETWRNISDSGMYELPFGLVRHLAIQKARGLNTDRAKSLCKLLELGKVAPVQAVEDWVADHHEPEKCLALLTMHQEVEHQPWLPADSKPNAALMLLADAEGVDPETVKVNVKGELAAKWKAQDSAAKAQAEKAKKADLPLPPAAQADGGAGGKAKAKKSATPAAPKRPKTTPEEALLGIAAAMQSDEEEGAPGAGRTGSEPDGASAVGEDGRATSPGASAAEPVPGTRDESSAPTIGVSDGAAEAGPQVEETGRELDNARQLVQELGKVNVRMLKEALGIGTAKALALIDQLEAAGVVSACGERGVRTVLVAAEGGAT